jgi:hypothetical protein
MTHTRGLHAQLHTSSQPHSEPGLFYSDKGKQISLHLLIGTQQSKPDISDRRDLQLFSHSLHPYLNSSTQVKLGRERSSSLSNPISEIDWNSTAAPLHPSLFSECYLTISYGNRSHILNQRHSPTIALSFLYNTAGLKPNRTKAMWHQGRAKVLKSSVSV